MQNAPHSKSKQSGSGQLRKLFYTKGYSDVHGAVWKVSTWKVLVWLIAILVGLMCIYSFFVDDQISFFQSMVFYAIITVFVIAVVWVCVSVFNKSRKVFIGFILAWILILGLYMLLGFIFSFFSIMEFHYGFTTWMIITFLSLLGAKRIDGNLDKNDIGYGLLVLIIIIIGNVPIFEVGGFIAQLDSFLSFITDKLVFIDPQNLVAD